MENSVFFFETLSVERMALKDDNPNHNSFLEDRSNMPLDRWAHLYFHWHPKTLPPTGCMGLSCRHRITLSDHIYEGDSVRLHKSGFSGTVAQLGWLKTVLRGSNEIIITIPNTQLLSQQVCNLSRIHQSQVKQTLRFPYGDSEKLPQLLQDVKTEIRSRCPSVITDGSHPFPCYWTDYADDHLEVIVDAHFQIKPVGDAYPANHQHVLQAIDRAVKKNNMEFYI
jgi:small-conductance mechanosensitive channel